MWRSLIILLGLLLLGVGGWLQYSKPELARVHELVKIGGFRASVTEHEPVPPWVSMACLFGGVALLGVGVASKG